MIRQILFDVFSSKYMDVEVQTLCLLHIIFRRKNYDEQRKH
jgi:hypothetical protein